MKFRTLGKTGFKVSEIGLGTWQVGGKWGETFDHANADRILNAAVDAGVNFIDTADVYSAGLSEQAIGRFIKTRKERLYVATKCGRQLNPHTTEAYTGAAMRKFVEASLQNMSLEILDLVQLHCPPTEVYRRTEVFGEFEKLKAEGKILHLGISVEKVEEALLGIQYDNVCSVQIIFNMFRQKPAEDFFAAAKNKNVGVIVRVPLASGLLTGRFHKDSHFGTDDHRFFNRNGEHFDKGETFSGIDFETGLLAVEELKGVFKEDLANAALKWILEHVAVSTVIPGASTPKQAIANMRALDLPALNAQQLQTVQEVYTKFIKPDIHPFW